jgi:HPr kinase/phosphorylase
LSGLGSQSEEIFHATTIACAGRGALITGASGSGKSGLAIQMLALGADLIADDRTRLWRVEGAIMADVPEAISGQIEARGVGILAAPAGGPVPIALVIDMDRVEPERLPPARMTRIMDVDLPLIRKVENPCFPAAILLYLKGGRIA